jgi:hypothetical protein
MTLFEFSVRSSVNENIACGFTSCSLNVVQGDPFLDSTVLCRYLIVCQGPKACLLVLRLEATILLVIML